MFQSTRPRGARLYTLIILLATVVSIHAPTRGATYTLIILLATVCFNPRAHAGRDEREQQERPRATFQSTRPRGARHDRPPIPAERTVSIHAPTRGATVLITLIFNFLCFNPRAHAGRDGNDPHQLLAFLVSIHAPTRGATHTNAVSRLRRSFQSTRPRGARRYRRCCWRRLAVSIHAPTRGATFGAQKIYPLTGFNPRAHAGRDVKGHFAAQIGKFQSTRPRGARRSW